MRQINESYLRTLISKSAFLRMFNSVEHLKMTAPIGATFVAGVHLYINIPLCVFFHNKFDKIKNCLDSKTRDICAK